MSHHLINDPELGPNTFKSGKYPWCKADFFPMKFSDPLARRMIRAYASFTRNRDSELSADLMLACAAAGGRQDQRQGEPRPDDAPEGVSLAGEAPTGGDK